MASRVKLTNNCKKYKKLIEKAIESSLDEIGVTGVAEIQSNTPVISGDLRRSITFKSAKKSNKYSITFGSPLAYASKVELVGKSKGFMRNSLRGFTNDVIAIITKHLKKVGK